MITKFKIIRNHQGFMKYFKNTSWLFFEKILRMLLTLVVNIWIARYLGVEQFGILSFVIAFVGLFLTFSTLGLDGIIIRELVTHEHKRDEFLGTAFGLKLIGAFIVLVLLAIAVKFTSNDIYTNTLIFIIASAMIFQSFNVIDFYFQSIVLSKYVVFAKIISLLTSTLIRVFLLMIQAPLVAFAWVILVESIVLAFVLIMYYFSQGLSIFSWQSNFQLAKKLLKDSWPLIFSGLVVAIYMKIDQIMIKEILGNEATGQYSAAVMLSEAWYFIPIVVSSSLFPAIIKAKKSNLYEYHKKLQSLFDVMAWIAILVAISTTFFSEWIIELFYGVQYKDAGSVLMIHIWSGIFVYIGVVSSKWFLAENLQLYSFYRTLAGAILNIFLNYILIPTYGIEGAAFSTLFSQFIASYFFNFFNKKVNIVFRLQTNAIFFPLRKLGFYLRTDI